MTARARQDLHKLSHLISLLIRVAAGNRLLDTMCDVILEDLLDTREHRANGSDLGDDVNAIGLLFDHSAETANLAFDAAQTLESRGF